jgi:Ca-activated chloride channel family protein
LGAVQDLLEETDNAAGVAQRAQKQMYKSRLSLAAPASGPETAESQLQRARGGAVYRDLKTDKDVVAESVRNSGNVTLYRRGRIVVTPETANLDVEKDKDSIQIVDRYSDAYFQLVADNTADENKMFSSQAEDEELLVNLRGQAYLIK